MADKAVFDRYKVETKLREYFSRVSYCAAGEADYHVHSFDAFYYKDNLRLLDIGLRDIERHFNHNSYRSRVIDAMIAVRDIHKMMDKEQDTKRFNSGVRVNSEQFVKIVTALIGVAKAAHVMTVDFDSLPHRVKTEALGVIDSTETLMKRVYKTYIDPTGKDYDRIKNMIVDKTCHTDADGLGSFDAHVMADRILLDLRDKCGGYESHRKKWTHGSGPL